MVFPGRGLSCTSSSSFFLWEYLFVSCGCLFPNSCVHASLCSVKNSHPKGFICTPTKWIGSRFSVFSGPSSSCKRFLDTYGFLCLPDPLEISVSVRKTLSCSAFWWIWLGVLLDVRIVVAFLVWQRNFDKTTSSMSTSKVSGNKDRPTAKAKFSAIHSLAHCRPFSVAPQFFFLLSYGHPKPCRFWLLAGLQEGNKSPSCSQELCIPS